MQIHLKSYYYNGGGDGNFQLKAKHSFTLDPSAGFFLKFSWLNKFFGWYLDYPNFLRKLHNSAENTAEHYKFDTENKPDIQNISITTKNFKVFKQC